MHILLGKMRDTTLLLGVTRSTDSTNVYYQQMSPRLGRDIIEKTLMLAHFILHVVTCMTLLYRVCLVSH